MVERVLRKPLGQAGLLDQKGGQSPVEISDTMSAVIEATDFYLLEAGRFIEEVFSSGAALPTTTPTNGIASIMVPEQEIWAIHGVGMGLAVNADPGDRIIHHIGFVGPLRSIVPVNMDLLVDEQEVTINLQNTNELATVGRVFEKPFFLPGGWAIGGFLTRNSTTGAVGNLVSQLHVTYSPIRRE